MATCSTARLRSTHDARGPHGLADETMNFAEELSRFLAETGGTRVEIGVVQDEDGLWAAELRIGPPLGTWSASFTNRDDAVAFARRMHSQIAESILVAETEAELPKEAES